MKVLITGSSGMLGSALWQRLEEHYDIVGIDIKPGIIKFETHIKLEKKLKFWDIAHQEEFCKNIRRENPDLLIHAAAYTDVDGCELNPQKANEVNAQGTENVALACKDANCLPIYISTDFVFDGEKKSPYIESDSPNPIGAYGRSKLEGERHIQSILKRFVIIRSSWLFGPGGENFVDIIINKAKQNKELRVVKDQVGSPTYTQDLAEAIAKFVDLKDKVQGIYHVTNSGSCSWYEFAQAIKEITGFDAEIKPITSGQYPTATKRPKMSILENRRYLEYVDGALRNWKEALREYLAK